MFFLDSTDPLKAIQGATQSVTPQAVVGTLQKLDLGSKLATACLSSIAGFVITQALSYFQDKDRSGKRNKVIREASEILELCGHLQALSSAGTAQSEIAGRLRQHLDRLAEENLRRIQEEFEIEAGAAPPIEARGLIYRIIPLYPPGRPWLWIHHALFFIALGSLSMPIWGAIKDAGGGHESLLKAVAGHWASIAGVLLSSAFFSWLAFLNDRNLRLGRTGPQNLFDRVFLCFEPRGGLGWAGHIAYLSYCGILIRFLPNLFESADLTDATFYIGSGFLGFVLAFPAVVFNLTSNYAEMRSRIRELEPKDSAGTISKSRDFGTILAKALKSVFLIRRPAKAWLWPMQIIYYLIAPFILAACLFISSLLMSYLVGGEAEAALVCVIVMAVLCLPLITLNSLTTLIDLVLKARSRLQAVAEQSA